MPTAYFGFGLVQSVDHFIPFMSFAFNRLLLEPFGTLVDARKSIAKSDLSFIQHSDKFVHLNLGRERLERLVHSVDVLLEKSTNLVSDFVCSGPCDGDYGFSLVLVRHLLDDAFKPTVERFQSDPAFSLPS